MRVDFAYRCYFTAFFFIFYFFLKCSFINYPNSLFFQDVFFLFIIFQFFRYYQYTAGRCKNKR